MAFSLKIPAKRICLVCRLLFVSDIPKKSLCSPDCKKKRKAQKANLYRCLDPISHKVALKKYKGTKKGIEARLRSQNSNRAWKRLNRKIWRATHPEKNYPLSSHTKKLKIFRQRRREVLKRSKTPLELALTVTQWDHIKEMWDYSCAYCRTLPIKDLTQDHMTPISLGGQHTASNVIPSCRSCNSRKGIRTFTEYMRIIINGYTS